LEFCVQKFGSERVLFGSNFPVDKIAVEYDELVAATKDALWKSVKVDKTLDLTFKDFDNLFYNNAVRWYRIQE
jgi:predicted TIM-barrel fold metal-dependent hydrolase